MAKIATPTESAKTLTTRERLLLFCAATDRDWAHAAIAGAAVTAMMVKGLIGARRSRPDRADRSGARGAAGTVAPAMKLFTAARSTCWLEGRGA